MAIWRQITQQIMPKDLNVFLQPNFKLCTIGKWQETLKIFALALLNILRTQHQRIHWQLNQTILPLLIASNEEEYEALRIFSSEKLEIQQSIKKNEKPVGMAGHLPIYRYMKYFLHYLPHAENMLTRLLQTYLIEHYPRVKFRFCAGGSASPQSQRPLIVSPF